MQDAGWSAAVSVGRRRSLRPRQLRLGAGVTRGGRPRFAVQGPRGRPGGPERRGLQGALGPGPGSSGPLVLWGGSDPSRGRAGRGRSGGAGRARAVAERTLRTPDGYPELSDAARSAGKRLAGPTFIPFHVPPSFLQSLSLFWPHALIRLHAECRGSFSLFPIRFLQRVFTFAFLTWDFLS